MSMFLRSRARRVVDANECVRAAQTGYRRDDLMCRRPRGIRGRKWVRRAEDNFNHVSAALLFFEERRSAGSRL